MRRQRNKRRKVLVDCLEAGSGLARLGVAAEEGPPEEEISL